MEFQSLLYLLAALLVLVGIAGTVLPALPGVPLVFAGLLVAAWADGFQHVHWAWMLVLALLTLFSMGVDLWATALGAKRVGASRLAVVGAMVGTLAGLFFGPLGLLLGPFAGALGGELLHRRSLQAQDLGHATKVGFGTWFGILFGTALKLAIVLAMLGLFGFLWWLG